MGVAGEERRCGRRKGGVVREGRYGKGCVAR